MICFPCIEGKQAIIKCGKLSPTLRYVYNEISQKILDNGKSLNKICQSNILYCNSKEPLYDAKVPLCNAKVALYESSILSLLPTDRDYPPHSEIHRWLPAARWGAMRHPKMQ